MGVLMNISNSSTVTISSKGWVVIPASLRKKFNLEAGMKVLVKEVDGQIVLEPQIKDPVDLLFGKLSGGESLTQVLLKEKSEDRESERNKIHSR
jgi:AbrB family looped-hinge helix DNA binding protein